MSELIKTAKTAARAFYEASNAFDQAKEARCNQSEKDYELANPCSA